MFFSVIRLASPWIFSLEGPHFDSSTFTRGVHIHKPMCIHSELLFYGRWRWVFVGMVLLRVDWAIKVCSRQQTTASNYKVNISRLVGLTPAFTLGQHISVSFHVDLNIYFICSLLGFVWQP